MKFEIADWRFEVTWDGLLCQPIERGRAKAAKKSAAQPNSRERAGESNRHALGLAVQTFNKQTHRKGATK
jgi:hypothetical protein